NNINMSAFSIADTSDFGMLRMIVDQPEAAFAALKKQNFSVSITPVVGLIIPDKAGSLYHALNALNDAAIGVEYMYAFSFKEDATVILRTADAEKTAQVLKAANFQLISTK
ncbi:MAG TPA: hypothetical protein PLK20_07175, partial [Paludibacteraceae bacterium]|nr:hypothetical protein [Paludibacteraceae bacterium]